MLPIYLFQIDEGMGKAVIVKKQGVSLREIMEKKREKGLSKEFVLEVIKKVV
jgi:hypothetical protein